MAHIASIEKLCKDNFDTWKLQIEAILVKNDHWEYVIGAEAKPAEGTTTAEQEKLKKWIQADQKAKADIILSMSPSELCHIKHCTTSNEVWIKLKDIYESKGPAKKAALLKQLLFRKLNETETMSDHLNIFFEIVDKLRQMDIQIADDLLSILLLYSIPDNFENFRCAIEARDELPKPEALKIKLMEEWEARKGKTIPDSQKAYYSCNKNNSNLKANADDCRSNQKRNTFNNRLVRNFKCNYCSKIGHKASECRKKIADRKAASSAKEASFIANNDECESTAISLNSIRNEKTSWCMDSGATSHMCNDENLFLEINKQANSFVKLAVDKTAEITGKGTVRIVVPDGKRTKTIRLENVLCVPELKSNLLSTAKAATNNRSVIFTERDARVVEANGNIILKAERNGNLYYVDTTSTETAAVVNDFQKWHQKYGHLNENDLKKLKTESMVRGLSFNNIDSLKDCKICIKCKQTAAPFSKESKFESKHLLDLVHSDVCGPMRIPSLGGSRYFVTFIDNKSRYVEISFLKTKDEVKNAFLKFQAAMENRIGKKIKTLRTDNGLEYCGAEFDNYLEMQGIRREKSAVLTPQQNGIAERMNRTIIEMARCLILQSRLPANFWAEAVNCAAHLRNRAPTRSTGENKTPYEMFFGSKPSVAYLKVFGQKAFVLNKRSKGKFDPRSYEHIFIGYSKESKAYRLWDKNSRKVITSRDVRFINEFDDNLPAEGSVDFVFPNEPRSTRNTEVQTDVASHDETDVTSSSEDEDLVSDNTIHSNNQQKRGPGRPRLVYSGKAGRPRKQYNTIKSENETAQIADSANPTVIEALSGKYKDDWKNAMQSEYEALVKENAWELVDRPKYKKIIDSKWVLKTKYKQDGTIEKFKARLVAKGCAQTPGIDFEENFSPVARLSSIRTVIAYAVENGFTAYQLDFVMAYVNGELDETIFMEQPEGFQDISGGDQVCLLKRSLYGLKQSGRQWYKKLDEKLKYLGFKALNSDKCVYRMKTSTAEAIIVVYVDDLIVFTKTKKDYDFIRDNLANSFKMKDMGSLHYCLGIEFVQNNNSITMSQKKYIEDVLNKFKMQDAKPLSTPMDKSIKLNKEMCPEDEKEKSEMKDVPYRSLIGSLMYLSVATRPDITYSVNFLSQFNNNPGKAHWLAAKRVLRYLKGTKDKGITYTSSGEQLTAFVDADWASDVNDRKSYTGFIFKYAGGAITWESRKQRTVALSTTEAEYMALCEAAKETVHLRRFFNELSPQSIKSPTAIYCDNQSAQKLVHNPVFHSRTKHIDIRYHFVREIYERGEIDIKYLSSLDMPADILTKGLNNCKHQNCCNLIM